MKKHSRILSLALFLSFSMIGHAQTCDLYVGGYVPSYRNASTIDYSRLSHVFYAFAGSSPSGALILDSSINGNFTAFKAATIGKKRYLSLEGGDTVNTIRTIAGNPTARAAFVSNCVSFCSANAFNGIDMDWENIDNSTDSTNFYSVVNALSTALHANGYELIITLSYNYNARYYGLASLNKADWIQLMAYDETGWGPGSPYGSHSPYESMENAVNYWYNKGYTDRSRIVIGLPFYAYQFASHGGGTGTAKTYNEIATANTNLKTDVDSVALTPFNSAGLLKKKVDHVKFSGLKGVFVWELGQDLPTSNTKSLLRAIADAACDQNPYWADYSQDPTTNLALNRPVESSSGPSNVSKINDNNTGTFWTSSSANADTAWIHVDFGASYDISKVEIVWEQTGIGRDFEIKITNNSNGTWTTIQRRFYNSSLVNTLAGLNGTGRYVSIQGLSRGCNSRYKVAEFRVYGTAASGSRSNGPGENVSSPDRPLSQISKEGTIRIYPNPAINQIRIDLRNTPSNVVKLELINQVGNLVSSRQVKTAKSIEEISTDHLPAGMYFVRATMQNQQTETQKLVVQH